MNDISERLRFKVDVNFESQIFHFIHTDDRDHIFSVIKDSGEFYEQELLSAVRPLLRPGDWVVDVGANIGNHTVFFAGVCGCNVMAFEPNPAAARLLRKNIELNRLQDRVQVHEIALGSRDGTGSVVSQGEHNLGMAEIRKTDASNGEVEIGRLSNYVGTHTIRLIKIDTEGMDFDVLLGAEPIIERDKSAVTIEASHRESFMRISGLLGRHGYTPAGSFNYTPTHLFLQDDGSQPQRTLSLISRQSSLDYIDHAALRDTLSRGLRLANKQRDQLSAAISDVAQEFPIRLSKAQEDINAAVGEYVRNEIGTVSRQVAGLETGLETLRSDIGTVGISLGELEEGVAGLSATSGISEQHIERMGHDIGAAIENLIGQQSEAGRQIAGSMAADFDALRAGMAQVTAVAASVSQRAERTDLSLTLLTTGVANMEGGLAGLGAKLAALETDIGRLEGRIHQTVRDLTEAKSREALQAAERISTGIGMLHTTITTMEAGWQAGMERSARAEDALAELLATGQRFGDRLDSSARSILEKNDRLSESVLLLTQATNRSDARLDAIARSIAQIGERQAAQLASGAALTKANNKMLSSLKDSIEAMAQIAVLWAEAGNLRDAAQDQTQAMLRRDIDVLKRQNAADDTDRSMPAALAPGGKRTDPPVRADPQQQDIGRESRSVWRVVRRTENSTQPAIAAPSATGAKGIGHESSQGTRTVGSEVIADDRLTDKWDGLGWATGKAALEPGGIVRATGDSEAGFVTRKYPFAHGGLVEIEIDVPETGAGSARPFVSILSDSNEGIGPEFALGPGTTTVRAFAPGRTREIKLRIHSRNNRTGDSFAVRRLIVRRIDKDAHQRSVAARIGEPVLASMASIPSRRTMLADAVNSLLAQCDRVRVFLNHYPDVPDFLLHPRVDVRRSQDWDDRGDAGKMFWLEHDKQPGYRLIVDDDLIFPPDFADVMCAKVLAKGKQAIYATHGVLLRQPVSNYYDDRSRAATFHFGRELAADRRVHIGATNALCLHSDAVSMRWSDFKYCNSADIWLALHAQQKNLEVLTPARPLNWVRENRHAAPEETIYRHSLNRTRTRFDSSLVQDAVLKHHWPLTVKLGDGHKYGAMLSLSRADGLSEPIRRFLARTEGRDDWVVMLAFDRSNAALDGAVAGLKIERETHLIDTSKGDAITQAADLMETIGVKALMAIEAECLSGKVGGQPLSAGDAKAWRDTQLMPLMTDNRKTVGVILAGRKDDAERLLAQIGALGLRPPTGNSAFAAADHTAQKKPRAKPATKAGGQTINAVFQQVKVLNLERRADRWESASRSLALAQIKAERFSAVDGALPAVAAEYESYLQLPQTTISPAVRPVAYQRDLYMDYTSQTARIAFLERSGKKAIASRGAWGYLRSYEAILEQALAENTESLLVFDDDVLLHRNIQALFAEAMKELPDDWLILQFGTLQYNWTYPWMDWASSLLYRTNGSAVGSHAVGMRFDVIPFLLDHVKRMDMPYDIGALSSATRAFPDRCFVIHPNLAIQSLVDSDIGTSDFQQQKKRTEAAATYRWNLEDYQ